MENTLENKAKFFAQYWGQEVFKYNFIEIKTPQAKPIEVSEIIFNNFSKKEGFLELKPLSSISDEDAIEVANLAHQTTKGFKIIRKGDNDIFLESNRGSGLHYGIRIGCFYNGEISTWWRFEKDDKEKESKHTINIGKINITDTKPIPYISIVDYLRSKGYALPYNGLSVEKQVKYGWVKLKNN